jgi:hypothetical protein
VEGQWHFFYFSYSGSSRKAVGYVFVSTLEEDSGELSQVAVEAQHQASSFLRFRFGGRYVMILWDGGKG